MQTFQQSNVVIRYVPTAKQEAFHNDRYKVKYRLLSGGTGSGKTLAGVWEMISYLIDDNPGAVGFVFEPTIPMVKRNLIKGAFEKLLGVPLESNRLVEEFVKTDNRIDFVNGSRLWFGSLEDPEMAEGPNIDIIHIDEARLVRHFDEAWRVVQRRIRGSKGGTYPTGAYITTTPNAPNSDLYEFFENPLTRHRNSKVYRMSIYDNPYLTEDYRRDIEASHTGGFAERFVYGRFAAVGAMTFPYDSTIHEVQTVDKRTLKTVCFGVDFGWTNPSAVLAVGFDGDDRAYVLDEFYHNHVTNETLTAESKALRDQWGNRGSAFHCDSSEPRSIDVLNRAGIRAYGNKTKREDGIHNLARRFNKAGDGKPRIYVRSTCVNLIAELLSYSEDVKEFDHAVDALRYAIMNHKHGEIEVSAANVWGKFGYTKVG